MLSTLQKKKITLAGVAQWMKCQPANQRVAGSIPSLGFMPGLQKELRGTPKATTH